MRGVAIVAVAACVFTLATHASAESFTKRFNAAPPAREDPMAMIERKLATPDGRARFAREYENVMLGRGIDMHANAMGPGNRTLALYWIGFSRPTVYQLLNQTNFLARMKRYGFDNIKITDGVTATWRLRRAGKTFALY